MAGGVLGRNSKDFRLIVDLDEVRRALTLALNLLEEQHGRHLALRNDFYWDFGPRLDPEDDDLSVKPEAGLASVVDDYEEGIGCLTEPAEEIVLWHTLGHLGGLVRCLGDGAPTRAAEADLTLLRETD